MMLKRKPIFIASIFTIAGLILGLIISSNFNFHSKGYSGESTISKEAIDILTKTNNAVAEVAEAVKPSVVNISSTKTIKEHGVPSPFFNDPFFRRFFGDDLFEKPREHKQSGLGSGVIVDKDGYILTNNHVIKDADEIRVKLSDKREFKGKVIGTDKKTDIAVVKIDAKNLPALKFGDSDKLKVGETVLAIGNPFGLNLTVTTGIISATGRANVGIADYEDFIQTDAAINPGNSGGALVNVRGELVGINTAILSTSGGYQGIGFAIPSNMAKTVMDSLIKKGKVVRGWLGINIQDITPELAKQFNLKSEDGVLVADVVEDSPAEKAGIERGDVIVEFDGKDVKDSRSLRNMVAGTAPDTEVKIKLIRNGSLKTVTAKISEISGEIRTALKDVENLLKGVSVQDLTPSLRKNLNIQKKIEGVVVTDIEEDSPAEGVLMKEDVIMEVNRKKIKNVKDYESVVSKIKPGQNILLLLHRKGATIFVTLTEK